MSGHPSAELLARYSEGDLGDRRARKIRVHLGRCPACSAVLADLGRVSEVLAGARPPVLPAAVAERLDVALAAAAAERAAARRAAAGQAPGSALRSAVPGRPDLPDQAARRGRSHRRGRPGFSPSPLLLRGLAAAAAVVVLAGGGVLVSRISAGTSPGPRSSASPATPTDGRPAVGQASASAGSSANLGPATGAPGAVGVVLALPYSRNGSPAVATVVVSPRNLAPQMVAAEVQRELATSAKFNSGPKMSGQERSSWTSGTVGGFAAITLGGCVASVAAGSDVLLVEIARYQGSPASIIVTPGAPAPATLRVTIVGTSCSATNSDVIARTVIPSGS